MGRKWEENGTKYPVVTVPLSSFFRRSKMFPTVPFVRISFPHSSMKNGNFCHSPTLIAMAASADAYAWGRAPCLCLLPEPPCPHTPIPKSAIGISRHASPGPQWPRRPLQGRPSRSTRTRAASRARPQCAPAQQRPRSPSRRCAAAPPAAPPRSAPACRSGARPCGPAAPPPPRTKRCPGTARRGRSSPRPQ